MIYETIYKQLKELFNGDIPEEYQKRRVGGIMDLNVDILYTDTDEILIALAHNYIVNGDVVADPDMQIRIFPPIKMAEAMTYQDLWGYREVYPQQMKDGELKQMVNPQAKVDLNKFLNQWLKNLKEQGFTDPKTIVKEDAY